MSQAGEDTPSKSSEPEISRSRASTYSLQDQGERLAELFQQAPVFFAVLDGPDFVFEMVNSRYQELIGARDVIGRPLREALPEAAEQGFEALLEGVYRSGQPYVGRATPIQLKRKTSGELELRYLDFVYDPVRAADGSVTGVMALGVDVTEARLSEMARRNSEERLQLAMDAADLGMWAYDPMDGIFHADANMQRIFGSPEPTGEHDFWSLQLHPDDRKLAENQFLAALAGEGTYDLDYRVLHPEGVRWIHSKGRVVAVEGEAKGMFAIVEDITSRKEVADALRDSEERLRLALSATGEMGSFDWNIETDRVYADENYCRIAGLDPEAGRGAPIAVFIAKMHPEDQPLVDAAIKESMRTGKDYEIEYRFVQSETSIRTVLARGSCLLAEDGRPIRFPGVIVDITERKRADAALLQTEKLAAVGRLAASIAHEINNPLESVTNLIYLASHCDDLEQTRSYLKDADAELRRASAITSQTLRFHRQSTRATEVSCLDLFTSALLTFQSRLPGSGILVEKRKRAHRPVLCFDGEVRQVMCNVIGNALDAMQARGGRLLVRSREGHDWSSDRAGLVLTVADTGPGMSAETLQRIFEPFYTTKGIGGTGLGLWITKEIVERHAGRLAVRSSQRPGHCGTVFTLFLPFDAAIR